VSSSTGAGPYVLITAAYDEEASIGGTIESVLAQSPSPARWVVASDGSTDRTDEIVAGYAASTPWLRLVRREKSSGHDFAAKVGALQLAQEGLAGASYAYLGVLDADVRPCADYFAELLARFEASPKLGIAGGNIVQIVAGRRVERLKDPRTVAGGVQFFRRECFEQTGGFLPLRYGGEDALIEVMARMHGWEVGTFLDLEVEHQGLVGDSGGVRLGTRRRWGRMNRCLGYHPLYELVRCLRRITEPPFLIGSLAELSEYWREAFSPTERLVPESAARFLRAEQLDLLRALLGRALGLRAGKRA